jgi:hypothetical protein
MSPVKDADHSDGALRRRRRRGHSGPDVADGQSAAVPVEGLEPATPATGHRERRAPGRDAERGWRDLAGNSPSQVGVSGAMRARDIARPTPEDIAKAERDLMIVRRQWQPPETNGDAIP